MRWGISSDAFEYHGTTDLCLQEIQNCKKTSLGPNFVTLIGQKYGLRPLPTSISVKEFEILNNELQNVLKEDLSIKYIPTNDPNQIYLIENIMKECYKLDINSIPNRYRILPISRIIPTFNSEELEIKNNSRIFWEMVKTKLLNSLRIAAESAFENKTIDSVVKDRYFVSSKYFFSFN
jgi:hypothetical protein